MISPVWQMGMPQDGRLYGEKDVRYKFRGEGAGNAYENGLEGMIRCVDM